MIYADCMLVLGVLLSASSQLRAESFPVGPGEALLGLWVACMLVRELARGGPGLTAPFAAILAFWCLFWLTQSIGLLNAYAMREVLDMRLLVHDVLAFALVCMTSCLMLADRDPASRLRRTAWLALVFGATLLAIQISTAWLPASADGLNPWYWDRFRGWSENPNQLSLLCCLLVLIGFHLVETSTRMSDRLLAILCVAVVSCAGLMTQGNSFRLGVTIGLSIIAAVKVSVWLTLRSSPLKARSVIAWILVGAVPVLGATLVVASSSAGLDPRSAVAGLSRSNDATAQEAAHRVELWTLAWDRGFEAGLFGMGPGPHIPAPDHFVGYTKRLREDSFERLNTMPVPGIAANFESHNTYLELFLQGGFLLVGGYLGFLSLMVGASMRRGYASLAGLVVGVAVYGIFHVMLRNPIVWFAFALALTALASSPRAAEPRRRLPATWRLSFPWPGPAATGAVGRSAPAQAYPQA